MAKNKLINLIDFLKNLSQKLNLKKRVSDECTDEWH